MPRRPTAALEAYGRYRQPLQARWRPLILERDRRRCRACGARDGLEVAHITDAVAFVRAGGHHRAVTFSYRWDNLVTLCDGCHALQHAWSFGRDEVEPREAVLGLFEGLRRLRGWHSPFAVLPPGLVPAPLRPRRSFHDVIRLTPLVPFPTYARYAADGGLVFGDQEARPGQARLTGTPRLF